MSTIPSNFNYAAAIGIQSLPAAIVFAILYVPLLAFFFRKSFTHPTYVHYVLTFFCLIRVVAFTIRAVLAGSESAGETLNLVIAEQIISSVGYFSLLYSSYTLVLDRTLLSDLRPSSHPILKFTQIKRVFRLLLLVAVVLGIVAGTETSASSASQAQALRIASLVLFLFLTIIQALQTGILATSSISGHSQYYTRSKDLLGIQYGNYILVITSILLIIREVFSVATVTNTAQLYNEHLWYPLIALPEILVVILYVTPGLVPRRDELQHHTAAQNTTQDKTNPYETA